MGQIICFSNQKGGVGKTSTCVNLTAAVKVKHRDVLLVDADPQGNASSGMGVDKRKTPSLYDAMMSGTPIEECITKTDYGDVIHSNISLSGATVELVDIPDREQVMRRLLIPLKDKYEYIFIDCPPSLGLLTINALTAADSVLIPVQCEYYAMEGLTDLIKSMRLTRRTLNPELKLEGILLTMYDRRLSFSAQVAVEIRKHFGKAVFNTTIPRNVRIAEAPSHGKPVGAYSRMSRGAEAYDCLAVELFRHNHVTEV